MQIIQLTDIHGADYLIHEIASDLKSADLIVLSGDITHFGKEKESALIIDKIRKHNKNIFAVTGNCDFPEVQHYIEKENFNLNREIKEFNGFMFSGISGSLPCPGKTPNEYTEDQLSEWLTEIDNTYETEPIHILVSHQPPANTVNDRVSDNEHVGSVVLRKYIEHKQPILCLTGHIHEGIGVDSIGSCTILNPGPFRTGKFAAINFTDNVLSDIEIRQITA